VIFARNVAISSPLPDANDLLTNSNLSLSLPAGLTVGVALWEIDGFQVKVKQRYTHIKYAGLHATPGVAMMIHFFSKP
jgi:hypothetical protein